MGKLPSIRSIQAPPTPQQAPLPMIGVAPPPQTITWRLIYTVAIGAPSIDTTSLGDLPLPAGGIHAMVDWEAADNSANVNATLMGLQIAVHGGAIDTAANYHWSDNLTADAAAAAWSAGATTGGGIGTRWMSRGRIKINNYNEAIAPVAWWDTAQLNSGMTVRRSGMGYYAGDIGPVTRLHFFSGAGSLVAPTKFHVWVALLA